MNRKIKIFMIILTVFTVIALAAFIYLIKTASSESLPEIEFDSDVIEASTAASDEELLKGVTAMDAEDGDVTDSLLVEGISRLTGDNTATVTYSAFDSHDHVSKAQRTVKFTDYKKPVFTLNSPLLFKNTSDIDVLKCIQATDVFDGDISRRIKYSVEGDTTSFSTPGMHNVEFRVTNSKGDTTYMTLPVEITEAEPNPFKITLSDYLIYLPLNAQFDPASYFVRYTAAGETYETMNNIRVNNQVNTAVAGTYIVSYSFTVESSTGHTNLVVVVG